ncbi:MAG: DUF6627 family protein [Gammaproteobacteria bacterium]
MKLAQKCFNIVLSLALMSLSFNHVEAALVGNDQVIFNAQKTSARAQLIETIERSELKQQLRSLGFEPDTLTHRVNLMTDDEIATLNQQIGELPAGGDILGVLLIIFIVFVITDVIGATDIFPFIKPVN